MRLAASTTFVRRLAPLLVVTGLVAACGLRDEMPVTTGDVVILLEHAASTPRASLEELVRRGAKLSTDDGEVPFTVLLLAARLGPPGEGDLWGLGEDPRAVTPADLLAALEQRPLLRHPSRVSALERNFVEEVSRELHGDQVLGFVRFRLGDVAKGEALYVAERGAERWRVTSLSLPHSGLGTTLQPDGTWRMSPRPSGEDPAGRRAIR